MKNKTVAKTLVSMISFFFLAAAPTWAQPGSEDGEKSRRTPLTVPKSIGVFCSADDKIADDFKQAALKLGQAIAQNGYGLTMGGSKTGLMNEIVNGYVEGEHKGPLQGILPTALKAYNVHHLKIPPEGLIWTEGMHERLSTFHKTCGVIVVMPGGFGTLHELMDFLVHNQFGLLKTKIVLLNLRGFWDGLLMQFDTMLSEKALKKEHRNLLEVVSTVEECIKEISQSEDDSPSQGLQSHYWEQEK